MFNGLRGRNGRVLAYAHMPPDERTQGNVEKHYSDGSQNEHNGAMLKTKKPRNPPRMYPNPKYLEMSKAVRHYASIV